MLSSSNLFKACCSDQLIDKGSEVQGGTLVIEIKLLMIQDS